MENRPVARYSNPQWAKLKGNKGNGESMKLLQSSIKHFNFPLTLKLPKILTEQYSLWHTYFGVWKDLLKTSHEDTLSFSEWLCDVIRNLQWEPCQHFTLPTPRRTIWSLYFIKVNENILLRLLRMSLATCSLCIRLILVKL